MHSTICSNSAVGQCAIFLLFSAFSLNIFCRLNMQNIALGARPGQYPPAPPFLPPGVKPTTRQMSCDFCPLSQTDPVCCCFSPPAQKVTRGCRRWRWGWRPSPLHLAAGWWPSAAAAKHDFTLIWRSIRVKGISCRVRRGIKCLIGLLVPSKGSENIIFPLLQQESFAVKNLRISKNNSSKRFWL